jgi:hypothetical protein
VLDDCQIMKLLGHDLNPDLAGPWRTCCDPSCSCYRLGPQFCPNATLLIQSNPIQLLCAQLCAKASAEEEKGRCGGRTLVRFIMCQPWLGPQNPDLNQTPSLEAGSQGGGGARTKAG